MKDKLFSISKEDLNLTFFSGKGAGGQHRNRHKNCVRINHKDSGAMVVGQSNRKKACNIKEALENLVKHPRFRIWHAKRVSEIQSGETIIERVESGMLPANLKIEQLVNERWVPYCD